MTDFFSFRKNIPIKAVESRNDVSILVFTIDMFPSLILHNTRNTPTTIPILDNRIFFLCFFQIGFMSFIVFGFSKRDKDAERLNMKIREIILKELRNERLIND